jgi:glutaredoxin
MRPLIDIRGPWIAAVLAVLLPAAAFAGGTQCSSSEAAESLVSCDHCQQLKELLGRASEVSVELTVHDLDRGVIIDLSADDEAGLEFVRSAVTALWGVGGEGGVARVTNSCSYCEERSRQLQAVERDHAITDRGAYVILTSDDDALVQWSRKDAQTLRNLIERSASSH